MTAENQGEAPDAALLRVFSYLPNPRVWKAEIAAELCGMSLDVRGDKPRNLGGWLWDFDARAMEEPERKDDHPAARLGRRGFSGTLFKTNAFLAAHPFGTVPAAFSPDGSVGIFESNSILRAVARVAAERSSVTLYGTDHWQASRIDSFLDANLVFAREAQVWLLALASGAITADQHERMTGAYGFWLDGLESALASGDGFLVGGQLSIADISFVCDFAQFLREQHYGTVFDEFGLQPVSLNGEAQFPTVYRRLDELAAHAAFATRLQPYLRWRGADR